MNMVKIMMAGAMAMLLSACATGLRVYTDADPAADFSRYRTFAFYESAGKSDEKYATLHGQRIEDAVSAALEARGYSVDINTPDLLINYHLKTEEKTRTSPPVYYGGYYGYRSGMYVGWPGYVEPGYVDNYTEGTITVDMVDRRTDQMIWEGTAIGRIDSEFRNNPDLGVRNAVAAIFGKYPYVAGSSVPVMPAAQ